MSQVGTLVEALKKALRARGLTYLHVARGLGMSESAVKRLFAQRNMSLNRLEEICNLIDLELSDLLELTRAEEGRVTELTEEQERTLVGDPKLLLVGLLAINHWTAGDILKAYRLTQAELVGLLTRLDRLEIIDLLAGNRIKVRLARNFTWRKGGPIQRFFEARVQQQFFESSFLGEGELRLSVHGSLSNRSNALLQQRMRKMAEEFDGLVEDDRHLDHRSREVTSLVLAIRPWELSSFTELRRKDKGDGPSDPAVARQPTRRGKQR